MLCLAASEGLGAYDVYQIAADVLELRTKWAEAFAVANIDSLLYPAMPIPAFPHGMSEKLSAATVSYLMLANLLTWPCGTVPVTTVRSDEQRYYDKSELPEDQRDSTANLMGKVLEDSAGMPIGLSIMTPPYRDETCLRVMKEVERVVRFKEEPLAYKESDVTKKEGLGV